MINSRKITAVLSNEIFGVTWASVFALRRPAKRKRVEGKQSFFFVFIDNETIERR